MITNNPWLAGNIESFLFLNCPECTFKTKQKHIFQGHAIENHPLSCELFNESFNPEIFDPGHLDISSKYDKTLEEVMFEDDLPLDVGLSYIGGFQLEFVSISRVINHMTCYKFEYFHWLKLQHSDWRANLVKDFF